ncbi:MAG: DNA polymerase III subunit delta' [Patescibacteria group bacterium]|nr:DNA polymerase III subunit delta' [Patescibacteria group bacterium]
MSQIKFNWPICGHQNIVNFLQHSIQQDNLMNAYLFYGSQHLGKTAVAKYFIQSIFCSAEQRPCQQCVLCQQIQKNIHPDIIWLTRNEDKKNITIEQIRELRQKLRLESFLNSYKIAVIQQAELMTTEASNALLKTLEEPSWHTIIILIADQIKLIPSTVISRCQTLNFKTVSRQTISQFLKDNSKLNKLDIEKIVALSLGRPGIAMNFIQQTDSWLEHTKRAKEFVNQILVNQNLNQRFKYIQQLAGEQKTFIESQNSWQEDLMMWSLIVRDLILIKKNLSQAITYLEFENQLRQVTSDYTLQQLTKFLYNIQQTGMYLKRNLNPKLVLENLILSI